MHDIQWLVILKAIHRLVLVGWAIKGYIIRKRDKLEEKLDQLKKEINSYGEKVGTYKDFNIIVERMFGNLQIIKVTGDMSKEEEFWKVCRTLYDYYKEIYHSDFLNFNDSRFYERDKKAIIILKDSLKENIGKMEIYFSNRDASGFKETVSTCLKHCQQLKGFVYTILEEISENLKIFTYK